MILLEWPNYQLYSFEPFLMEFLNIKRSEHYIVLYYRNTLRIKIGRLWADISRDDMNPINPKNRQRGTALLHSRRFSRSLEFQTYASTSHY